MKKTLIIIIAGAITGVNCFSAEATENVASLNGKSYSVALHETSGYAEGTPVQVLFTTYDENRYALPYYYDSFD